MGRSRCANGYHAVTTVGYSVRWPERCGRPAAATTSAHRAARWSRNSRTAVGVTGYERVFSTGGVTARAGPSRREIPRNRPETALHCSLGAQGIGRVPLRGGSAVDLGDGRDAVSHTVTGAV